MGGLLSNVKARLAVVERRPHPMHYANFSYATVPDAGSLPDPIEAPPGSWYIDLAGNVLWENSTGVWVSHPVPPAGSEWPGGGGGGGGGVPTTRRIDTALPLQGGGDLTVDRTITILNFTSVQRGVVPQSGGGTVNFLRADGSWVAPPAGDEVFIGPADPGGAYDLWFDSDANGGAGQLYARVGGAWVPASAGGVAVQPTRRIDTTLPLTGGGDLSADRTLAINTFTSTVKGAVPPPTTVTGKFLKDDGSWALPAGGVLPTDPGLQEVFVGPTDPGLVYELWYDTDSPPASSPGAGLPSGGSAGQVLTKQSVSSFDAVWANMPRGLMGSNVLTTNFLTTAPHTTLRDEGLTVTFDEVVGRKYEFTMVLNSYVPGGVNNVQYRLLRNGVSQHTYDVNAAALGTTGVLSVTLTHLVISAVGGTATWKVQFAALGSDLQASSYADANYIKSLHVKDIG